MAVRDRDIKELLRKHALYCGRPECREIEAYIAELAADLLAVKEAFEKYRETYCPWEQTLSS